MKLYGIKNCDTVKKACKWLNDNGVEYEFHDYKKQPAEKELLSKWIDSVGWEPLVNKRGTTWRKLPDNVKESVTDKQSAIAVMLENNSIIKRPVIDKDGNITVGFDAEEYKDFL